MSLLGQFSLIGNITSINTFQPQQKEKKKKNDFLQNNPSRYGVKSIILKWWWCHFKKDNFHIQNEIRMSSLGFGSAMQCQWLMRKSSQNPPKKTCSSLVETIPHCDQKRPSFHRAANPPTHSSLFPSCSLWFSLKTNNEIGCRPADCFELHP